MSLKKKKIRHRFTLEKLKETLNLVGKAQPCNTADGLQHESLRGAGFSELFMVVSPGAPRGRCWRGGLRGSPGCAPAPRDGGPRRQLSVLNFF